MAVDQRVEHLNSLETSNLFTERATISSVQVSESSMIRTTNVSRTVTMVLPRPKTISLHPPVTSRANEQNYTHYQLATYEGRLMTFRDWPVTFLSPECLAEAGFYYKGNGDTVVCAKCLRELSNWCIGDDPRKQHFDMFAFSCY